MARRLRSFVHGLVDENGAAQSFGPADTVPAWAERLITNPHAWADEEPTAQEPAPPAPAEPTSQPTGESPVVERLGAAGATADELEVIRTLWAEMDDDERADAEREVGDLEDEEVTDLLERWRALAAEHDGDLAVAFEELTSDDEQLDDEADPSAVPPKAGPGSGQRAWAAYAKANSVDVDDDTKRDDIIAQLEAAGVPVEPVSE